jgi:hypothetical protein
MSDISSSNAPAATGLRRTPWADPWFYPLLACFLLTALLGTHLVNDSDVGFHLKGGQWILENHCFPSLDTYTYSVPDHPYLDIHWLYQVLVYLLYRLGGYPLLILSHAAGIIAAIFLAFKRLRLTGAPLWICSILLTAALFSCEIRFRTRPEIASWVLFSLTLWVLELRMNQNRNLLFLLPLLQLVWVNVEGLFILGWGLMGIYGASGFFQPRGADPKLLRYCALSVAADLVNPYFLKALVFPLSLLVKLGGSNVFKQAVKEFQSPWSWVGARPYAHSPDILVYQLFSFFLLFLLLATFRRRRIQEWLLAAAFFGLSASALRNIPLFMIACLPLAAACWRDLRWEWIQRFRPAFFVHPLAAGVLTLFLLGLSLRVVTGAYYVYCQRTDRFGLGVDGDTEPLRACDFLVRNHLAGRILNSLDAGDWLDWAGPPRGTFIDGRLEVMGNELFSEYDSSLKTGGLQPLADKYRADIIFFNTADGSDWALQLNKMKDWRMVYLDECAAIYLRKGFGDSIPPPDFSRLLAERGILPFLLREAPSLLETPPPGAWSRFWGDFFTPVNYPGGLVNLGIFSACIQHPAEAELFFLEAIRRTGGRYSDFYLDLGSLYFFTRHYNESLLCVKRVLKDQPDNPAANKIMGILSGR